MHIRGLTAVSLVAALGLVAGCDAGNEPGSTGDTSSYESGQTTPAPDSSVMSGDEQTADQEIAGAGETTSDRTGRTADTGELGQTDPSQTGTMGQTGTEGQIGMTEFAALDTNSDGKLEQTEWQPEIAGGMEFQQIDGDSSGDIDRDEFRQALASAGDAAGQQMQQMQDRMPGEQSDMNTLDDPETEQ